ncbi:hypothetical protein L2U69_16635 [Zavarzinia compransoris]|uniref:hypothetical protein n=1 Tax=Zavarzinia marina TaxID=2911065 RepID=UPI001F2E8205|nr:hypothetical protein [Zavarzinia marina]MCF4167277.1 hypothetical protein [Zavarzinia marina]
MTQRYCFLGNSHIAALKFGWDQIAATHPDVDITMFAAGGRNFENVVVKDKVIEATTEELRALLLNRSNGLDKIVLTDYDKYVIVGLGFDVVLMSRLYGNYHTILHSQPRPEEIQFVSIDVMAQMLLADLRESLSFQLARLIRDEMDQTIYVCWVPLKRKAMLHLDKGNNSAIVDAFTAIVENGDEKLVRALMTRIAALLRPEGIVLIEQPEETVEGEIFTFEELSKAGTTPADTPNPRALLDIGHMNRRFGSMMVKQIISATAGHA